MKSLYLLRHAKSSWDDPAREDRERVLDRRGERAATLIGVVFAQEGVRPARVLCSDARRTRQTAELALAGLRPPPPIELSPELYLADVEALLARVRSLDDQLPSALLIGHNPGLHDLARQLASEGSSEARRRLDAKLPTGGFVEIQLPVRRWRDVRAGDGTLIRFLRPKDLV